MKEADIKRQICDWLALQSECFFWVQSAGKIPGRIGRSKYQRNGIADILGIFYGRPLAIEVKTEKGRLSPEQKDFLENFTLNGGVAIVARDVDEVIDALSYVSRHPKMVGLGITSQKAKT